MGDVIMGWMVFWRAVVAKGAMTNDANSVKTAFYEGQLQAARQRTVINGRISG